MINFNEMRFWEDDDKLVIEMKGTTLREFFLEVIGPAIAADNERFAKKYGVDAEPLPKEDSKPRMVGMIASDEEIGKAFDEMLGAEPAKVEEKPVEKITPPADGKSPFLGKYCEGSGWDKNYGSFIRFASYPTYDVYYCYNKLTKWIKAKKVSKGLIEDYPVSFAPAEDFNTAHEFIEANTENTRNLYQKMYASKTGTKALNDISTVPIKSFTLTAADMITARFTYGIPAGTLV